ncbi:MAG TPA: alpha/beta fold hydrolase, partial [Beutenbergiaceae bacterium]|nr:alpha/beta fold hydrolase [Beutenbergiaceae bacterium]
MFSPKRVRGVLAGVTLVVVGACSLPAPMLQQADDDPPATQPPTGEEEIDDAELEEFYSQTVDWEECGTDQECATVTVPIDYAEPESGTIDLALKKHATRSAEGMVLFNPGGPGGSGVDVIDQARYVFTPELLTAKEIVGFDPRGVGQSAPISCYDDDQLDELYTEVYDVETDEGFDAYVSSVADYVQACKDNNPETIAHVDTVSAARDMDVIRAALGVEKLDYLGFSYGTKLGAIYAELFGPHVGRFVLDGAMTLDGEVSEITHAQVEGFERAYREYLQDCLQGPGCPFDGGVDDAYDQTLELLDRVVANPVDTGDRERPAT